jgi:hypothetical protein
MNSFGVNRGYPMTDPTGTKTTLEQSGVPFRRRVFLAAGNAGFFVVAYVLFGWLVPFALAEASWWIKGLSILIFLIALEIVDRLLRVVLLRPLRRSSAERVASVDRPR